MKKSVAIGLSAILMTSIFSGCAKKSTEVQAAYVPKSKYIDKECKLLENDMENVSYRLADVTKSQDSAHNRDVAMAVVGTVLFWPAYFVLFAGDSEAQLAKLKGEFEAIDEAMVYNHCYARGENGVDYIRKAQEKIAKEDKKVEKTDIADSSDEQSF
ncbi:hypothetical protein [Hydrogenimonas urashimensis]|uniref:hypothetical protein n=1 Tax=Hydrogenimonas urashimensis TaxID=2740515 RepID=UPI001914EA33|nr:hypothetical protein [Hydrogenimonas urashimensis]